MVMISCVFLLTSTEWYQTFVLWLLAALHFIEITFFMRKSLNYAQNSLKLRTVL